MAKKAKQESQEEQSERFRKLVQDMEAAGDLNPTEGAKRFDSFLGKLLGNHQASGADGDGST
jgi:hypothetical protein